MVSSADLEHLGAEQALEQGGGTRNEFGYVHGEWEPHIEPGKIEIS